MRQAGHEQQVRSTIEDTGESTGKQKNSSCSPGGFGFRDLCSGRCAAGAEFDSADGPHPVYTKRLLDGLQSRGIRATFFVVGENISGSEELIRRMADEGHVIGNHTYSHIKLSGITDAEACGEVQKTDTLVRELTGSGTEFIRPPFGSWKKTLECELEMIPVLWDVDPLDWTTKNTGVIVQRVLEDVEPGDIILLHDFYGSSVDAALEIADQLLAQGYELVTVDELILI